MNYSFASTSCVDIAARVDIPSGVDIATRVDAHAELLTALRAISLEELRSFRV